MPHQSDGKVIVFAPYSRDAESIIRTLAPHGIEAGAVDSVASLVPQLGDEVGAVVMSEEALAQLHWKSLVAAINAQPSWSSYPFILIVGQKRFSNPETVFSVLPAEVSNVIVLERPMGSATLLSAIRSALAGRRRQFVTRNHLRALEENARQQALLTRELAHRVKNTIAVLQSIVMHTLQPRPEVDDLRLTIVERFAALSRAHDLLLGTDFIAADFKELVDRSLEVHGGNFVVNGPSIDLSPQASLSFALVMHELATNAVKYGSLHSNQGIVEVTWQIADDVFTFRWKEMNGRTIEKPEASGFGSRLIRSTLEGLGNLNLSYEPSGFQLAFSTKVQNLRYGVPEI